MGNYYQGKCFSTTLDLHREIASNCPTVSPDGAYLIQCTPSETKIVVTRKTTGLIPTTTNTDYIPQQITCDPELQLNDGIEMAWLIVGVWVSAWCIKQIINVIRS